MDWRLQLMALCLDGCDYWQEEGWALAQRRAPYGRPTLQRRGGGHMAHLGHSYVNLRIDKSIGYESNRGAFEAFLD